MLFGRNIPGEKLKLKWPGAGLFDKVVAEQQLVVDRCLIAARHVSHITRSVITRLIG